jgi:hypothetical protein
MLLCLREESAESLGFQIRARDFAEVKYVFKQ